MEVEPISSFYVFLSSVLCSHAPTNVCKKCFFFSLHIFIIFLLLLFECSTDKYSETRFCGVDMHKCMK